MRTGVRKVWWGTGLVLVCLVAGCNVSTPQFDALKRDLEVDQRDRVRVYNSCRERSNTVNDLDECMKGEGLKFIAASNQDYRSSECWTDRYNGNFPKAYCWENGDSATPKP